MNENNISQAQNAINITWLIVDIEKI